MDKPSHKKNRKYWFGGQKSDGQDTAFEEALDSALWEKGKEEDWDAYWFTGMPGPSVFEALGPGTTVNHIPGNNGVTVKSLLFDTLDKARRRLEGHPNAARFGFFPRVYSMPEDYFALQEAAAAEPDKLWIQKPKGLSRGRGIQVLGDAALAPKSDDWMVQEYLHRPHLYDGHKYVLRCYVVVRSIDPLRVYWYEEGFAKLASEKYSTDPSSLKNLFVHLTNPDVNEENEDAPASVVFISFTKFRQWLRDQGHDDGKIFQELEDLIVLTMMSVRERMLRRVTASDVYADGCYELFGLDCMLDADLKPWILECNLSPSLDVCSAPEDGGIDEARIKRQVVFDIVSMIGANEEKPDWSALSFEDKIRAEWDWEQSRTGDFRNVFPGDDPARYLTCFPVPRYSDRVLAEHVLKQPLPEISLAPNDVAEFVADDALALFDKRQRQFFVPNQTAAWIWLQLAEGLSIEQIIDLLSQQTQAPRHQVARDVWNTMADWGQKGLVRLEGQRLAEKKMLQDVAAAEAWAGEVVLRAGEDACRIRYAHEPVGLRLSLYGEALPVTASVPGAEIDVVRGAQGYTMLQGLQIIASDIRLSRIVPLLNKKFLNDSAANEGARVVSAGLVSTNDRTILVLGNSEAERHSLACALAEKLAATVLSGAVAFGGEPGAVHMLPFPLWVKDSYADEFTSSKSVTLSDHIHELAVGAPVRLVAVKGYLVERPLRIDMIVLVETVDEGGSGMEPMTTADILPALWSHVLSDRIDPGDIVEWATGIRAVRVPMISPMETAGNIAEVF